MSDCPTTAANSGDDLKDEKYLGLLRLLQGGIRAEGNSREEIEEIAETLSKTAGLQPTGETNTWRV